ncbi:signal peptidase II [Subtercola boreus]|uniref:Lipoprotein signal peptidase n=1 Tax=Subtercola boreus TaxID=120213 RepID=A0A3E0V9N1_9MICO|nr:signal peptidase II [Subtercola boreus]RFA06476.1 signal peptidase II [Subtercola boreus]TQL46925.1 signal peptidase II [Subtercola boreus]
MGPPISGSRRPQLVIGSVLLAGIDLIIKAVAWSILADGRVIPLGVIELWRTTNPGVAFSLGEALPSWVISVGSGVVLAALISVALVRAPYLSAAASWAGVLVIGGALGNFIDRLDGNGVVDYLHSNWFATFNLADVFITAGVVVFCLGMLLERRHRAADTKTAAER